MADNVLCHVCMQCFMPKMLLCIFAYLSLLSWFGSLLNSYSSIDAAFTYIYLLVFRPGTSSLDLHLSSSSILFK